MSTRPKIRPTVMIPLDRVHENEWNPNHQTDETFNSLVEEIKEDGFDHPLNVCPWPDYPDKLADEVPVEYTDMDGKVHSCAHFKIIGGAHRSRAARVLGYTEIPSTIYHEWDEAQARLKTVRRNLMTGTLDDVRFTKLVHELTERFDIPKESMPRLMGFDSENDFAKHFIAEKSAKEKTFLDDLMGEVEKEKHAVDSLSDIIATIFAETGDTVVKNYMHFTFKGSLQTVILCDSSTLASVREMIEHLKKSGELATDFMQSAIAGELEERGSKTIEDLISPDGDSVKFPAS